MPQFLIIIVLLLLIGAAAMTLCARRSTKTHRSSGRDCSADLTGGEFALHSSVTGRVPVAVSPSPSQLQGRDSLRLAPRICASLPVSSQQRQSSMLIACWDFPSSMCLSRLSLWP